MTVIINLIGQPSSGKSSLALRVACWLKNRGILSELALEKAKKYAYKGIKIDSYMQYWLFGNEVHSQASLFNHVDCIISDSSPILCCFYNYLYSNGDNSFSEACKGFYKKVEEDGIKVLNFYLPRMKEYVQQGRFQGQQEADELAKTLKNWLDMNEFPYEELTCPDEDRLAVVLSRLAPLLNNPTLNDALKCLQNEEKRGILI